MCASPKPLVHAPALSPQKGDLGDRFYIVERGDLGVFKDRQGPIKTYGPGGYLTVAAYAGLLP